MKAVPLAEAREEAVYGGKSTALGAALRAGLKVPEGMALDVEAVEAVASGEEALVDALVAALAAGGWRGPWAVRSSAVGEDGGGNSFAGQHLTRLNVIGREGLREAILAVRASGRTGSALAYRKRLGIPGEPRVAIAVQQMVVPEVAGVLFTRNPLTGADERLVEAAWGLGEAVVAGLVTPDRWRLARGGGVIEAALGEKDLEIVPDREGIRERTVEAGRAGRFCLGHAQLAELDALATACESHFRGPSDIEFAFAGGALYLLQRRPVTR